MSVLLGLVLSCSQPHVDPKTGDITEGAAVATAAHDGGCAPAGGPKPDVPTQPAPAPEPEKPPIAAKAPEGVKRDQPCPGDKSASAEKPADKPAA